MYKTKVRFLVASFSVIVLVLFGSFLGIAIFNKYLPTEVLPTAPHIIKVFAEDTVGSTFLWIEFRAQVPEYSKLKIEISKDLNYHNSSKLLSNDTIDDWKAGYATVITRLQSGWIRLVVKNNHGYQAVGGSISFCSRACY